jgi:hypothetical protein
LHKQDEGGKMRGEMGPSIGSKRPGWIFALVVLVPGILQAAERRS